MLIAGCGGSNDMIEHSSNHTHVVVSRSNGIRLTLLSDRVEYEAGQPVMLTFEVTNIADTWRSFLFPSACQHDFWVHDGDELVWSVSWERVCTQVLTSIKLAPGKTWTGSGVWDRRSNDGVPVGPGNMMLWAG